MAQVFLHHGAEGARTERAVDTDGIRTHALKERNHGGGICPRHELAVLPVGVGHEYGKAAVFLGGQKRGLGFIAVVHRFDEDEIHSLPHAAFYGFGKGGHRLLKIKVTVRAEHPSRRPDIECHVTGDTVAARGDRLTGKPYRGTDDLSKLLP